MQNKSMTFQMRLPTCTEYDELLRATFSSNNLCHWHAIYTLCRDADPRYPTRRITRGFIRADDTDHVTEDFQNVRQGFRPFLAWQGQDPFPLLPVGARTHFGSIYVDGLPIHLPIRPKSPTGIYAGDIPKYTGGHIELRPAASAPIPWIKLRNGFIADRVLLCDLSWSSLKEDGYVTGRTVELSIPGSGKQIFSTYTPTPHLAPSLV